MAASSNALQDAIRKLVEKDPKWKAFDKKPAVGERQGSIGTGHPAAAAGTGGSGSFVESSYASREYWPTRTLHTSDGVFSFEWAPVKKMLGKGGVTFEPAEPPA